jgi:hypothetical protein
MNVRVRQRMLQCLLGGSLIVGPTTTIAQQPPGETFTLDPTRAYQVQEALQKIEANRTSFVNNLIADWQARLDPSLYDVREELGSIAIKAPAWRLLAASLVGEYQTMTEVLLGKRSAGQYIAELTEPEEKMAPEAFAVAGREPEAIGANSDSLVYTPIAPCRIVDTRGAGARTGILGAGSQRVFDLESAGLTAGQGGAAACPGLPPFSYAAWAINITVTGFSANGGLTVWGVGTSQPSASAINYSAGHAPSIANGLVVPGCYGCGDDIVVRAFGADTHVIIDVVGYFQPTTSTAAAITRFAGTPVNIAAGGRAFVDGANCPSGTRLISGENDYNGSDVAIGESRQDTATAWTMWMINNDAGARSVTVFSRCLDIPAEDF